MVQKGDYYRIVSLTKTLKLCSKSPGKKQKKHNAKLQTETNLPVCVRITSRKYHLNMFIF